MSAKRKYNIKGSRDFIVLAGIFFFICLWAVKDAWYPSDKVVEKHPLVLLASFDTGGLVDQLLVEEGDSVVETQVLAKLRTVKMNEEFDEAKKGYITAKNKHTLMDEALRNAEKNGVDSDGIVELKQNQMDAQSAMATALEQVNSIRARIDAADLLATGKGVVTDVQVLLYDQVEAGETVFVIDPKDHFYLFNKSLAIFSFFAFWVFLGVHIFAL